MELFNENNKLVTVIHKDHSLLPVINRLGVRLGFGDKTIRNICDENGIDPVFFVEIINVFHYESYFPEQKLMELSVVHVVDYLVKTHEYYRNYLMPEIDRLLRLFLASCEGQCPESEMIHNFYDRFQRECLAHFNTEEVEEFPFILALNRVIRGEFEKAEFEKQFGQFAMRDFEEDHGTIDDKMFDLENIIIKYLPPTYDQNIGNSLLSNLFLFERDMKNHSRIEDNILLPKVNQLIKALTSYE
jgi:regulator of cell morphogenesis and NO signaling